MNTEYTPGPWNTGDLCEETGSISVYAHGPLVYVKDNGNGTANQKANARLIASAPELLKALQGILSDYEATRKSMGYVGTPESIHVARFAIAKALGR